jgi:putative ABC transport system substrate-binding protein
VRATLLTVALAVTLLAAAGVSDAQPAATGPRIGVINEFWPAHPFVAAFRDGLRELGYTEGRNIVVEYRHAHGVLDRVSDFATDLIRLDVEVLVVGGSISAQLGRAQTTTVPIVFATSGDPVSSEPRRRRDAEGHAGFSRTARASPTSTGVPRPTSTGSSRARGPAI